MKRIDAHQHFWDPARGDYGWLTADLPALFKPFGPEDLAPHLAAHGISGTVLVQAAPSLAETEYLLDIASRTPFVRGVVGWIDFEQPEQRDALERLARHPLLKGLRPMIQDIADPDWMLRPALDWVFKALIAHDLAFDALVLPGHLANLRILIDRYPDLRVVIDHGAKPQIRDGAFEPWASDIARLARETGAFCKCSGLVTEARADWTPADLSPYLDHLLGLFGPERLIFGSDWPVLTLAGDYSGWFDTVNQAIGHWTQQQQAAVLGVNASRFYRLS